MFKVDNKKKTERRHWRRSGDFVNFERKCFSC